MPVEVVLLISITFAFVLGFILDHRHNQDMEGFMALFLETEMDYEERFKAIEEKLQIYNSSHRTVRELLERKEDKEDV